MKHYSERGFDEEIYIHFNSLHSQILTLSTGITYPDPSYLIVRENSPHYSIEYVYSGSGVVNHGSESFIVSKGDFFILYPNTYHHYYANKKDPFKKIFLTIDGDPTFINTLFSLYKINGVTHLQNTGSSFQLENIFELIKKSEDVDISHEIELLVLKMVAEISDFVYQKSSYNSKIDICKRLIERRITTKLSVDELCKFVNLDRSYLSRAFKKETGLSPSEYITISKIEYAMKLLSTTELSTSRISDNLSFTDSSHFIHRFQKHTGFTPSQYRQLFSSKFIKES